MKEKDRIEIDDNAFVTVTTMKHLTEVQHMVKKNTGVSTLKISKDEYVDLNTGEVREYNHFMTRADSANSLRQTFKRLRYLINNNFEGKKNELFITLTYAENMTDTERLYKDFEKFMKKIKRHFKEDTKLSIKMKFPKSSIDYICVVEPQERGAWHCHVLMKFNELDNDAIFIDSNVLAEMWGQGFVKIKSLNNVDNIGAYVSAYLTDIEFKEGETSDEAFVEGKIWTKEIDGVEKKFVKGGRLHMYPVGMNIYRKSKGIMLPERIEMTMGQIKKEMGSVKPHFQKSYQIVGEDNFENTITFLQFNTKR